MEINIGDTVEYHDIPGNIDSYMRTGVVTGVKGTEYGTLMTLRHPNGDTTWTAFYRSGSMTVTRGAVPVVRRGGVTLGVGDQILVADTYASWIPGVITGIDTTGEEPRVTVIVRDDEDDVRTVGIHATWPMPQS